MADEDEDTQDGDATVRELGRVRASAAVAELKQVTGEIRRRIRTASEKRELKSIEDATARFDVGDFYVRTLGKNVAGNATPYGADICSAIAHIRRGIDWHESRGYFKAPAKGDG